MDFDITHGSAILARTPATLHALLDSLDSAWTSATEGPDTWSAYDILGHLLHGERTDWIPRAQLILAQGDIRRFARFDRFAQSLRGEHPAFGDVTLRQLLATWVAHDLSHIAQIARVMAKQYRAAVGPWREYLPMLDR